MSCVHSSISGAIVKLRVKINDYINQRTLTKDEVMVLRLKLHNSRILGI